jgi:ribokinase
MRLDHVVDMTGTSDGYAAGFLAGYLQHYNLIFCGQLGAAVASHVAETMGCQTDLPTWEMAKGRARIPLQKAIMVSEG